MTEARTVRLVVLFLGLLAVIGTVGTLVLIGYALRLAGTGDLGPTAVALLATPATLASASIAGLGALLVSTRSGPPEPIPVTAPDPLPVQEIGDPENDLGT